MFEHHYYTVVELCFRWDFVKRTHFYIIRKHICNNNDTKQICINHNPRPWASRKLYFISVEVKLWEIYIYA